MKRSGAFCAAIVTLTIVTASAQQKAAISQAAFSFENATSTAGTVTAYLRMGDGDAAAEPIQASSLVALLDKQPLKVRSIVPFEQSQDGVLYMVLVDISKSVSRSEFNLLRAALDNLAGSLKDKDKVAVYTFGDKARQVQGPTNDKSALLALFKTLGPTDGHTALLQAVSDAIDFAEVAGDTLPQRRAIVVLSDGDDDGSGLTAEDMRQKIQVTRAPIYAAGLRRTAGAGSKGLGVLQNLAIISGGRYEEAVPADIQRVHQRIQASVRDVQVARLACDDCPADGQRHRLTLTYSASGLDSTSTADLRIPFRQPSQSFLGRWRWYFIGAGAGLLLAIAIAIPLLIRARRRRAERDELERKRKLAQEQKKVLKGDLGPPPVVSAPQATMAVKCTVVHGAVHGQEFDLRLGPAIPAIVGAGSDCAVVLERDADVADRHFELSVEDGRLYVTNLAPSSPARRNGVPIRSRARVEDGDVLSAGSSDLRVRLGGL